MEVQSDLSGEAKIPENKLLCKITGDLKTDDEHEQNRQQVAEELHGEYGYSYGQMETEYTLKAGSENRDADIVVFDREGTRRQEDIRIAIEIEPKETEPDDPDHGIDQAKSYMRLAPCEFGIWFNGVEHFYFHQDDGKITEIKDVPPHGSTLADIEQRTFDQLTPAVELKTEFERCHNYIAANQGLSKTEAFHELIKIIFCKTYDERHSSQVRFYVTDGERRNNPKACKRRIEILFERVKQEHGDIFDESDTLKFDAGVLSYVVAELESYLLLDTDSDVKGDAYETIVGSNLRGDRGEFFTPRNVCRAGVAMAFHSIPEEEWSNVDVPANSLDYPEEWEDNSVDLGKFDFLFTNPPFGKDLKVDDKDILRQYDLAHQWDGTTKKSGLRKSVPPQQLFIERSIQLLKPGGIAAIITPDSILTNPSEKFIRHWLLRKTKVISCVGLPKETFEPYATIKTHLVLFQKRDQPLSDPSKSNHRTFMAEAKTIGNDKRGDLIFLRTPEGEKIIGPDGEPIINDDLPAIVDEFKRWYK